MGRALVAIALYLASTAGAFAYGSVVAGNNGSSLAFMASANERTVQDAETHALQHCRNQGLRDCAVRRTFQNTCLSVGSNGPYLYRFGIGATPSEAQQNLSATCAWGRVACTWIITACDATPSPERVQAAAPAPNEVAQAAENSPSDTDAGVNNPKDWAWLGPLFAFLGRYWEVFSTLAWFAGAVVAVSLLRLCAWLLSAAPGNVLKERALICAWVGFPAAMAFVAFWTVFYGPYAAVPLLAWTDAFGALAIGGVVRKRLSTNWKAPAPLSLPLASFVFGIASTVPLLLFVFYGGPTSPSCGVPPFPLLSVCGFLYWQGVYFTAAILLLISLCGAVLPADSNLVAAHRRLGRILREAATMPQPSTPQKAAFSQPIVMTESTSTPQAPVAPKGLVAAVESFAQAITKAPLQPSTPQRAEVLEPVVTTENTSMPLAAVAPEGFAAATEALAQTMSKEETPMPSPEQTEVATNAVPAEAPSATLPVSPSTTLPVPVPEMPPSRAPQGIVLKLKRSQRSSLTGKVIFILDARVDLNREEVGLIRKYRLGDDVVYESSARKARQEATVAHLEVGAASKTSYRDSAGTQMLGVGKTFYRLARAGISATAAALSLRVTINSLMSGVHVECKSMGELMEAETAIVEAARSVRDYLDLAETFDGREEVLEF